MTSFTKYIPILAVGMLFIPSLSFAATQTQTQQLSLELSQIQNTLSTEGTSTTTFTLSPGQSIQQASSTSSGGLLTITFLHFLHSNPDPTIPSIVQPPIQYYAGISLEYDPCVAASPSVCVSEASSSYPVMPSQLLQGEDTGYLHYLITLTTLSSTTATFTVTDSAFLRSIQNQINVIATQVHALLGS